MDVAGIGTSYFDQLLSVDVLPVTDHHARTLASSWQYGGKVPTALAALARLGYKTAIHANGGGVTGQYIRRDFERHGVDCTRLRDMPGTYSVSVVALAEKSTGGRSFLGIPNPSPTPEIKPEELDKDALLEAGWLLISDLGETAAAAAKWFKDAGKPVVIDGDGLRTDAIGRLPLVDHLLICSYAYKNFFGECRDYEKNLRILRGYQKNDRAVTGVTLGADGAAGIGEDGRYFFQPAYKVDVVDTTGAGDVFHGAYIAGRLDGRNAEEAFRFSQAVSAVKCTRLGGRAGIPTMNQAREFMATGRYDFPELDERVEYYGLPPFERLAGDKLER
jgi:sulfofructose kinase